MKDLINWVYIFSLTTQASLALIQIKSHAAQ